MLRIFRTVFLPAALHGAEASLVSERNICTLRSALIRAAWSGRLSLANPGAVFSLHDGPLGSDRLLGEVNKSCMKVTLE